MRMFAHFSETIPWTVRVLRGGAHESPCEVVDLADPGAIAASGIAEHPAGDRNAEVAGSFLSWRQGAVHAAGTFVDELNAMLTKLDIE